MSSQQYKEIPRTTGGGSGASAAMETVAQSVWGPQSQGQKFRSDDSDERGASGSTTGQEVVKTKTEDADGRVISGTTPGVIETKNGTGKTMPDGGRGEVKPDSRPDGGKLGPQDIKRPESTGSLIRGSKLGLPTDSPPPTEAEEPSEKQIGAALEQLEDMPVSDLTKSVATALMTGKVEDVQAILEDMENDPDGAARLEQLGKELKQVFGTRVSAYEGLDQKFHLEFATQSSLDPVYEFEHRPGDAPMDYIQSSTRLNISSTGVTAQSFRSNQSGTRSDVTEADAETEATRLQAIGVNHNTESFNKSPSIPKYPNPPVRPPLSPPIRQSVKPTYLEIPALEY